MHKEVSFAPVNFYLLVTISLNKLFQTVTLAGKSYNRK